MRPLPPAELPDQPPQPDQPDPPGPPAPAARWWHDQGVCQIYPRSFCDSNGSGSGEIAGILGKLNHLQALGVGVVWLSPIYRSPMADNGYDISDYRDLAPEFGTLANFDALVAALHARGIRQMLDQAVNHCSDQHPWFLQACLPRDDLHRASQRIFQHEAIPWTP